MTQIWERLWVGSLMDAKRIAKGNPNGIDTVISLCEQCVTSKRKGVNYIHIPIEDEEPVPVGQFDKVMDAIAENIRWGTVLLHCGVGISRAPTMTAAWMHVVGYCNIDTAIAKIELLRPEINPSKVLFNSMQEHLQ
jgi:protein-tyrosine phosphatase